MRNSITNKINLILVLLIVLDLFLAVWGFFFPEAWYRFWHGAPYVDPQALLPRCAANWAAFFLFQVIALFKWRAMPWWLMVVAGMRLGDIFTDITCTMMADSMTLIGKFAFPLAGLFNLVTAILLIRHYHRLKQAGKS